MPTCLIVDDSSTMRAIARKMLRQLGYECDEAADGAAALERIRAKGTDLVLLDWEMPVMDGLETLKAMRAEEWGRKPKVVMCTSLKEMDRMVAAINAGADEYVMKPYDTDILAGKLSAVGLPV
jgi:two-component system chemotaxis response regulator CheY